MEGGTDGRTADGRRDGENLFAPRPPPPCHTSQDFLITLVVSPSLLNLLLVVVLLRWPGAHKKGPAHNQVLSAALSPVVFSVEGLGFTVDGLRIKISCVLWYFLCRV